MKNNKDIYSSLSNIKKALRDEKDVATREDDKKKFFLLENLIKKGENFTESKAKKKITNNTEIVKKKKEVKINLVKKSKIKKTKNIKAEKISTKPDPIENIIDNEIRPIINKWIKKNLRGFVKKVVIEEFRVISKSTFKQKTTNK